MKKFLFLQLVFLASIVKAGLAPMPEFKLGQENMSFVKVWLKRNLNCKKEMLDDFGYKYMGQAYIKQDGEWRHSFLIYVPDCIKLTPFFIGEKNLVLIKNGDSPENFQDENFRKIYNQKMKK
ncbi:hypothetical protein CSB11_01965 [Candidatus Campbellbacteria bacterium]|nr:MAG: hypothetical protein CSB11_01965 [Candidatus Campbellbacteria bacterium]